MKYDVRFFVLSMVSALDRRLVTMNSRNFWCVILNTDGFGCLSAADIFLTENSTRFIPPCQCDYFSALTLKQSSAPPPDKTRIFVIFSPCP